jgi:bifunctional non-homologous end joining protein LigD
MSFIIPAVPKLRASPPAGDAWIHEVKFDGWRIQLHKEGRNVAIYTKNGFRCAHKLELIAAALTHLPARSCIIDGELTAFDEYGLPNFHALHFHNGHTERCVWAFDLLYLDGQDLREHPLSYRKRQLEKLVLKVNDGCLRYSESFTDGAKLLVAAERMGLEGVVSKLWVNAYRSGPRCDWIKVKCPSWRETNKERWRLFDRH